MPMIARAVQPQSHRIVRRRGRRAFTAVELILAIVIGLLVASIGFTGFRIYTNEAPLKSVCQRLTHACSTARSLAIARNAYFRLTMDLDGRSFWIDQVNPPGADPNDPNFVNQSKPKFITPEFIDKRVVIEGVQYINPGPIVSGGTQMITFNPDGSSSADARVTFYEPQTNPAIPSNIYTVRIYGPTGHSKLFPRQRL